MNRVEFLKKITDYLSDQGIDPKVLSVRFEPVMAEENNSERTIRVLRTRVTLDFYMEKYE